VGPPLNYFASKSSAERYARGRPFFHPLVIRRVREHLSLEEPLPRGLDVCCGTGQSAVALKAIARRVVGVDISEDMLAHVPRDAGVSVCAASAYGLPFGDGAFDVATVCQALHWLEKGSFLAEARRVLRARGTLVVYDNYMTGRMAENDSFREWVKGPYTGRFPAPPREWVAFAPGEAEASGFRLLLEERRENEIAFTPESLTDFLTTHSNVIAAVEGRGDDLEEVRRWLLEGVRPFYGGRAESRLVFEAAVWCLVRDA
jgi:SAM-dependent methyltransferase